MSVGVPFVAQTLGDLFVPITIAVVASGAVPVAHCRLHPSPIMTWPRVGQMIGGDRLSPHRLAQRVQSALIEVHAGIGKIAFRLLPIPTQRLLSALPTGRMLVCPPVWVARQFCFSLAHDPGVCTARADGA